MTPDLEEMIRHRAHEIWEQEGRSHGRHEEHWQRAAGEITRELERIKAEHTPATAEEIEAPTAPRRGRPRKTEAANQTAAPRKRRTSNAISSGELANAGEGQQDAPRKRGRKAAGEAQIRGGSGRRHSNSPARCQRYRGRSVRAGQRGGSEASAAEEPSH